MLIGEDEYIYARYSQYKVSINGFSYRTLNGCVGVDYTGHLHGNLFTSYYNVFIKVGSYPFRVNGIRYGFDNQFPRVVYSSPIDMGDDILSVEDFTPVKAVRVDIKNEGFKLVLNCYVQSVGNITVFDQNKWCAPGIYSLCNHTDLFRYIADGELFALIHDIKTKNTTLTSSNQIIEVANVVDCVIKPHNDLYNNLKIHNPDTIKQISDPYTKEVNVYCYLDVYFSTIKRSGKIVELDMRKPNGGLNTKPAL